MSARYAYFEDFSDEGEFSYEDIAACDDLKQLQDWHDGCEATRADIHGQLDAMRAAGREDDAWVYRVCKVLGFISMGQSRIRKRMRDLGSDPNPLGLKLDEAYRKVQTMKADAAFAKNFVEVAREQFAEFEFRDLCQKAEARLATRRAPRELEPA